MEWAAKWMPDSKWLIWFRLLLFGKKKRKRKKNQWNISSLRFGQQKRAKKGEIRSKINQNFDRFYCNRLLADLKSTKPSAYIFDLVESVSCCCIIYIFYGDLIGTHTQWMPINCQPQTTDFLSIHIDLIMISFSNPMHSLNSLSSSLSTNEIYK